MTYKYFINKLTIVAFILGLIVPTLNAQPWTYDFGTGTGTANNSNSSTGNVSFFSSTPSNGGTYRVRIGSAGGSLVLANPGTSLGTGSEVQLNAATSTATNKFGVYDWNSPSNYSYLKAKIRTTSTGAGNINLSFGLNTTASDNQGYTSHYNNSLASLTIAYTSGAISSVVRRISGSNTTISSHGFTKDADQQIEVYANNSSSSISYTRSGTSYTLATKTWDLWVDGTRVVTNGATAGTLATGNITGFSFFTESSASNAAFLYIDDIEYANFLPGPPTAPTMGTITSGNSQLSVAFTAPSSTGGSAITNYEYSTNGGTSFTACSPTQTTSPIVITGLTNGTSYNVQIRAVNANGSGTATASTAATPYTTPSAPTIGTITPSNGQLSVAFTAGATGGSAITNYKYSTNGGTSFTACSPTQTTSPIVITGLTNGTSYDVQIKALNAAGDGTATSTTTATPYTTPSAPSITSVTPTNTTLTVNFTAGSTGGSAITDYKYSTNGGTSFTSAATTASPITINGLVSGTSYDIQIKAVNIAGDGVATATYTASTSGGCTPPTTQPTWSAGSTIKSTSATINFSRGNGTNVLVIARQGGAVSTSPTNTTSYTANATYGSGDAIGSGYVVYNGTGTSFTLSGLTYNTTYYFALYEYDNATNCYNTTSPATGSITTATPSISLANVSSNPIDFGTLVYPAVSAEDNYTVSGTNLVSALTLTAPTNFELATDALGPYNPTLTLNPVSEVVASTIVYVRFNPSSANGTNTGNLSHTATGATTQTTGVTAVALASQPTTASTITFGTQTTSSVVVNFNGGNGTRRLVIAREAASITYTPTDATSVPTGVNSVFTTATDQGSGNKFVYDGTGNTVTVTGLSIGTAYYFDVYEYNIGTLNSANYLTSSFASSNTLTLDNAVYLTDVSSENLTENLNTLSTSATASLPTGFQISSATSSPIYGTNVTTATTVTFGTTGTGAVASNSSGGFVNWADGVTASSTDRALGVLTTNGYASPRSLMTKIKNTIGETITSIIVAYNIEKYRSGSRAYNINFYTSTDGSSWTLQNTQAYAADANTSVIFNPAVSTAKSITISGLNIAQNANIYLRWEFEGVGGSTNSQGLAIDDIVITPFSNTTTASSPSPTPGTVNNLNINNDATLVGDVTVSGKLNIESGKKITLNGNTLTINGAVVGTPTFVSDGTSKLSIAGTGSIGTINFDQTTPGTTNKIKDLTINRTGATVTAGNALQIANNGTVTVTDGTFATSGNMTIISDLSGTGRIAELGAGASITGNVTIQRYMVGGASSQRGWRTMSSPVSGATYAQLIDDIYVTGPGGSTNGFDASGSNSSVMYYEEAASPGWRSLASINDTWPTGKGALVFFRGDRTQTSSLTSSSVAPNSFALDYIGTINSGTVAVNLDYEPTSSDPGWTLVGNPYPSQISWDLVTKTAGVDNSFYVINPNTKNYVSQSSGQISIGQGFFVFVNQAGESITFEESSKTGNSGTAYFKTSSTPLEIKMYLDSVQYDVASLEFKTNASLNYVFKEDAVKLQNPSYNLSFVTPNNRMVQRNVIDYLTNTGTDTFTLRVTSTSNRSYTLAFNNFVNVPSTKSILLLDKMNNSVTNLRVTSTYSFSVNNTVANTVGDRFALIITDQSAPLPVNLLSFTGKSTGKSNTITWTTVGEKNLLSYEVQRSTDNKLFETIGVVKPNNSATTSKYVFVDEQLPANATASYYRLNVVEPKTNTLSSVVTINRGLDTESSIELYPNPATNLFTIKNIEQVAHVKLVDMNGTELVNISVKNDTVDISELAKGIYFVVITNTDGTTTSTKLVKK